MKSIPTPNLDRLMTCGVVTRKELFPGNPSSGFEYFGVASDGVEVGFGIVWNNRDLKRLESYFTEHPTPDTW